MKKLLKKMIRSAPNVIPMIMLVFVLVGLPILQLYNEGFWITFLTILLVILVLIAYFIVIHWIIQSGDYLMKWAKED